MCSEQLSGNHFEKKNDPELSNLLYNLMDFGSCSVTLYTVDATEFVTAQIDATFHEGRGKWRAVS